MRKNKKSTKNKSIINNKLKSKIKKIKFKVHKSKKVKKIIAPAHVESIAKKPRKQRKLTSPTSPLRYFTNDTEQAIIEYNSTDDQNIKNELYITRIHQPFTKLVECIFNTFKFSYFEVSPFDIQKEAVSHLVLNIHKFDPERRSKIHPDRPAKAYSYFSIVAKHFLILLNNGNYKKFNQNVEIGEDREEHTVQLQQVDKHHNQMEMNDFMSLMVKYFEKNIPIIFPKQQDAEIANAVVELLRNSDKVDLNNKKVLYLIIREISNCRTQAITKILNKMKSFYKIISNEYKNTGNIEI
jgi:hypothetical protein